MHTSHLPIAVVFLLVAFFIPTTNILAQPMFTATQDDTSCGDSQTTICVTMDNMSNVNGISHQLRWDPSVLAFNSETVDSKYPELSSANAFPSSDSTFNFTWFVINPVAPSGFVNGDVLYCIVFDILNPIGPQGTPLEQFANADRPNPGLPPLNNIIVDGNNSLDESMYTFNDLTVMASSGAGVDTTPPTVSGCPTNISITVPAGTTSTTATWATPTATDNCGAVSVSSNFNSGDNFPLGTTIVQYTIEDASGNSTPCNFTVTITEDTNTGGNTGPGFIFEQGRYNCDAAQVELCVLADGLMDVFYFAHVISWDNSILNYNSLSSFATAGRDGQASNVPGTLNFIFNTVDPDGSDFTNREVLYCILFDIVGDISAGTTIVQYDDDDGRPSDFPGPANEITFADGTSSVMYSFDDILLDLGNANGIIDDTPPVISGCPSDISLLTTATSAVATWTPPTAVDACGGVTSMSTHNSGATFPLGTTTVSYTFTDDSGNDNVCNFDVEVALQDDVSEPGLIIGANTINCGSQTLDICITTNELSNIAFMSHVLVWDSDVLEYTDNTNNTTNGVIDLASTTDSTVNVVYNSSNVNGQDFMDGETLYCLTFDVIGDATDGVVIQQFEESNRPDGFPGPDNQILVAGDPNPIDYTFASTTVLATDNTPPTFSNFPTDQDAFLTADCETAVSWVEPIPMDDCAIDMVSSTHNSGGIFPVGTTVVEYTARDEAGNTTVQSFNIVVVDTIAPMLQGCPGDVTLSVLPTSMDTTYNWVAPTAGDNCLGTTVTGDATPGDMFSLGDTPVTYIAADASGNMDTCTFVVTVQRQGPEIMCPDDISAFAIPGTCAATLSGIGVTVIAGTASSITYVTSGATVANGIGDPSGQLSFNLGTTMVIYTVTDADGNSTTCDFTVTVDDNELPFLQCPADTIITVPTGTVDTMISNIGLISAMDNCTTPSSLSVTYSLSGTTVLNGVDDASGISFPIGTTTVTYTVTDEAGNSADCSFDVTVRIPTVGVECPNDTTVIAAMGMCDATIDGLAATILPHPDSARHVLYTATGATTLMSDTMGINDISGSSFNTGITDVVYSVIGNQGDTVSCSFLITVQDTFPPTFMCPMDTTVTADGATNTAVVGGIGLQNLMDCDPTTTVSYTLTGVTNGTGFDDASGTEFDEGTTMVKYFVMDNMGNRDSCSFDVIVEEAPIQLMCPTDVSAITTSDTVCTAVVDNIAAMVEDTGALASLTYMATGVTMFSSDTTGINDASGETFNTGTTIVTYTATDTLGNVQDCSFNVMVEGPRDLFITCPPDVTLFTSLESMSAVAGDLSPMAFGYECMQPDSFTLSHTIDGVTASGDASGLTFDLGPTGVTYVVQDMFGNIESCSFIVTVRQDSPITLDCPADTTLSNEVDLCEATVEDLGITIDEGLVDSMTLAFGGALIDTITADTLLDASGTVFPVGETMVTYSIVDTLGFTSECTFSVTVNDTQDPTIECPDDFIFIAMEGDTAVTVMSNLAPISFGDNCENSGLSLTYTLSGATTRMDTVNATGERFNIGVTTVTYTLTDASGNTETCSFEVEIAGPDDLAIDCPDDLENVSASPVSCDTQIGGLAVEILSPDSTIQSIVYGLRGATIADSPPTGLNDASIETFNVGVTTVTYIVTDSLGRVETCSFQVSVEDNTGPRIQCPEDVLVNIPFADTTAVVENIALLLAEDNCDPNPVITYELSGATEGTGMDDASGEIFNIGETRVTYTVTDEGGLASICFFEVTVGQFGLMFEGCPTEDIMLQSDTMECGIQIDSIGVSVTPVASIASLSYTLSGATQFQSPTDSIVFADSTFFNVGTTTVIYTAVDVIGDVSTCEFDVIVGDTLAPIFVNCPESRVVPMDVQECFATVTWTVPDIIEGCDFVMIPNDAPGTEIEIQMMAGDTTITYIATDVNGNISTCSFEITVEDQQLPNYIFCPQTEEDYTVMESDSLCGAIVTWNEPQNFDNCGIVSSMQTHMPGDTFPYGITTVTYTAFDEAGNAGMCSFDVVVRDSTPISFIGCPMDTTIIILPEDSTAIVDWVEPTVTGFCTEDDFTLENNFMPGDTFPVGMTTVNYIATDTISMTIDTCSFVITVQVDTTERDTIPPLFMNCPSDTIVGLDEGECFATVSWTEPTAVDDVGIDSLFFSHMPGDTFQIGLTEVIYIAIDSSGNRDTCAFDITVDGSQNSVLICPDSVTVIAPEGVCGSVVDWTPPTIDRPCSEDSISIVSNFEPGALFPVGTTEVIYIASDTVGFADTCSFMVTVLDQELPMFMNCLADTILSVEPGACEASFDWTPPTATDNCGVADFTASHEPPFIFPVGETTVTYTAVDISGNANNCQFIVRVVDDSAPAFAACPDTVMVRVDGTILSDPSGVITNISSIDCSSVTLDFNEPAANDDCSDAMVMQTDNTGLSSGSNFQPGTTTLIYTASDASDNTATCELVIVVEGVGVGSVDITVDNPIVCVGEDVELTASDLNIPGATYQWTLPDTSTFSGITLTVIDIPVTLSGTYSLMVTTPDGCTFSNTTMVTVEEAPTLSVSHNSEEVVCGGGMMDLVFTAASIDDIVSWSWTGPNGFTDTVQNPVIAAATAADSGNYIVTATTANGCSSEAMTSVSIRERPIAPDLMVSGGTGLSPVDNITLIGCSLDTFNLIGSEYTGDVQYVWSVTPNDFDFAPGNTNLAQAVITGSGIYTFEYMVFVDGCPSDTVTSTVNIEAQPIIQTNILGATSCVNADSSIVLQAIADGVIEWRWFTPSGGLLEVSQNVTLTDLNEDLNGTYRVEGTTANGCVAEAEVEVFLSNQLVMPIVGDLGSVCDGDELVVNLGGNYPDNTMFTWESDSTALNFTTDDADFDTADLAPGIYQATVTANGGGCVSPPTEIDFIILERPTVGLPDSALVFDCIATDTTVQLMETGEGGSKWFWFSSQGMFTSSEQNPDYTIMQSQTPLTDTVFVQVTSDNGCMAMDSVIVSFERGVPQPVIVGSARYCMGEELVLRSRDELPDSTIYTWTGPNGFDTMDEIVNIEGVSTAQDGVFTVQAQVGECISEVSEPFTVDIITAPELQEDGYVVFIGETDTLDITVNDSLIDNVTFSLGLINEPFRGSVSLQGGLVEYIAPDDQIGSDNFTYEICYDACDDPNLLLCDEAIVTVAVQYPPEQCVITTLVTPNNDGNNDNLIVSCAEGGVYPEHELYIFNQWGDEVFQAAPYNNDWDGTIDGTPLPSGTYFYVFLTEPGAEAQKGFISLYR